MGRLGHRSNTSPRYCLCSTRSASPKRTIQTQLARSTANDHHLNAWDVQFGIQRKIPFLGLDSLGGISLWGGISQINDGFAQGSSGVSGTNIVFDNNPDTFQVAGSEVNRWILAA